MSRPGNAIQGDGHDRRAAGVNRRWSGLTRHRLQRTLKPLPWLWPLEQRQRRHLSWQSPGLQARGGQIIDATLVPVPKQRNTREENKEIKAGRRPEGWDKNPNRPQQKDLDARGQI